MKRYPLLLLVIFMPSFSSMRVVDNSSQFNHLGYNNCNMQINGELAVLKSFIRSGDIVFDVGACIGEWSKYVLSFCIPTIYAFEPVPENYNILKSSEGDQFYCFNIALSDHAGYEKFFFYSKDITQGNFFDRPVLKDFFGVPRIINVYTEILDDFCKFHAIRFIDFVKIDTEGSELAILKSAKNLLFEKKIKYLQFEYGGTYRDAGTTLKEMYQLLRGYGYHIYRIIPDALVHISKWDPRLENYQYSNYFASCSKIKFDQE